MTKTLQEGTLHVAEVSPTASTVGNKLYGPSAAMDYRVILATQGGAMKSVTINASTGDEAAEKALGKNPGWKCAYVGPASDPNFPRLADAEA